MVERGQYVCSGWDYYGHDGETQPYGGHLTPEEAEDALLSYGDEERVGEHYRIEHRWARWIPVRDAFASTCHVECPSGPHVHYYEADGGRGAFAVTVLVREEER